MGADAPERVCWAPLQSLEDLGGNAIRTSHNPGQASEHGVEVRRELIDVFHREDPTRPVTAGATRSPPKPNGR